ncbi:hypothetical protein ABH922_003231 [Rhodococcus sp. 27YEA15]
MRNGLPTRCARSMPPAWCPSWIGYPIHCKYRSRAAHVKTHLCHRQPFNCRDSSPDNQIRAGTSGPRPLFVTPDVISAATHPPRSDMKDRTVRTADSKARTGAIRWGASETEAAELPGAEPAPDADWTCTHAVTMRTPPEALWPWLVQIGHGRAGFGVESRSPSNSRTTAATFHPRNSARPDDSDQCGAVDLLPEALLRTGLPALRRHVRTDRHRLCRAGLE